MDISKDLSMFIWTVHTEHVYHPDEATVISFFTTSNFYKKEAEYMIESMIRNRINHRVYAVAPIVQYDFETHERDLYVTNCSEENISFSQIPKLKPKICMDALNDFDRIMWVDCDSVFAKYPREVAHWKHRELGVFKKDDGRLAGGVIYFRKTPAVIRLLSEWDALGRRMWENTDQCALTRIVESTTIPYFTLPFHFIVKYDTVPPIYIPSYVTILHFQAERRMRHLLDGNRTEYHAIEAQVRRLQSNASSVL